MGKSLLFFIIFIFIISGCSIKKPNPYNDYEITYKTQKCSYKRKKLKNIFVDNINAIASIDRRTITKINRDNSVKTLRNVRFSSLPSDMIYKNIMQAIENSCNLNPIFTRTSDELYLLINILTFEVNKEQAVISIGYELFSKNNYKSSGIISSKTNIKDNYEKSIIQAFESSMNNIINQTMEKIMDKNK